MLPASIVAKGIQLCAAGSGVTGVPASDPYAIIVHTGAQPTRRPGNAANASATVNARLPQRGEFLVGLFEAGGKGSARFDETPVSKSDACAPARAEAGQQSAPNQGPATIPYVTALLQRAFRAQITDTLRPMNASYGSQHSWHKLGQAIDFVPAGGVGAIDRGQIRSLMHAGGVRLIELLGPGDRGHADHWHIAFAQADAVDQVPASQEERHWVLTVASDATDLAKARADTEASASPASIAQVAGQAPPQWDVFAQAERRASRGGGS